MGQTSLHSGGRDVPLLHEPASTLISQITATNWPSSFQPEMFLVARLVMLRKFTSHEVGSNRFSIH